MSTRDDEKIVEETEDARQGERQKGMPSVLVISTLIAAAILVILFVAFAA
jgi:hypothetical protein